MFMLVSPALAADAPKLKVSRLHFAPGPDFLRNLETVRIRAVKVFESTASGTDEMVMRPHVRIESSGFRHDVYT